MSVWQWARKRGKATKATALAAAGLSGLLVAGCGQAAAGRPHGSAQACAQAAVSAVRHDKALTFQPAACAGLTQPQLNTAVRAATAVLSGQMRGKRLMRARRRDLSPLLPNMAPIVSAQRSRLASQTALRQAGGPPLSLAALLAWLITVGLGIAMMARWIARGGLRRKRSGPRPTMNFAHLGLALAGLAAWIVHMATGLASMAWASCFLLLPVVGLGMSLLFNRPPARDAAAAAPAPAPAPVPVGESAPAHGASSSAGPAAAAAAGPAGQQAHAGTGRRPSQRSRALVLAAHITFSVATMLFTLMATVTSR